jgi:hypothetical protein
MQVHALPMRAAALTRAGVASPLLALALAGLASSSLAQDTHYWSVQYGPVAQLVGGQVIGGVPDLSATFYNPGALALRNESSYLLSTESVQLETISTAAQPGLEILDTSSSHFGAAPSLLAGVLPRWLGEDTRLAWSFLTRQKLDVRLGQRLTDPLSEPDTRSAAESYFDQRLNESWAGLTISRPLSESLGIGLTWYGVYRGQRSRNELSVQAVSEGAAALAVSGVTEFDYSHYRTLAKIGIAWQGEAWNAGLSVTTPSLGLFGGGRAAFTLSRVESAPGAVPAEPVLETETLENLDSEYRSSWAVGAGASWRVGATRLYASAEWFAAVDRFTVVALPDSATTAGTLEQELGSVVNAGLGVERQVNDDVAVYGAFHTDFSASVGSTTPDVAVSDWDLYHVSGGVSLRIRDNQFTLGALWAFGSKTRPLALPVPQEVLPNAGLDSDIEVHYSRITFLLGFVFGS